MVKDEKELVDYEFKLSDTQSAGNDKVKREKKKFPLGLSWWEWWIILGFSFVFVVGVGSIVKDIERRSKIRERSRVRYREKMRLFAPVIKEGIFFDRVVWVRREQPLAEEELNSLEIHQFQYS